MKIGRKINIVFMAMVLLALVMAGAADAAYTVKQKFIRFSGTAGETVAEGQMACIKDADGYVYKADSDAATLRPAIGVIGKGGAAGDTVEIIVVGIVGGWSSLSEGAYGYLSETAGAVTQSAPTWAQKVGIAISATEYVINCASYLDTSSLTALGVLSGATPLILEGASADAYETTIAVTDPTADRTVTLPDADVDLGAIANNLLAAPNAYFTIALTHEGQETATVDPISTFQMPFAATLVEVSVAARDIDTADGNETYTVDLEEAGTSVLSSAVSITADNTPVVGTVSDTSIADNAKMEVVLTLGGATPAIDDLTVLLTFKKAHVN